MTTSKKSNIERDSKQRVKNRSGGTASSNTGGVQTIAAGSIRAGLDGQTTTSREKATSLGKVLKSVDKSTHINQSRLATISEEIAVYGALARNNLSYTGFLKDKLKQSKL